MATKNYYTTGLTSAEASAYNADTPTGIQQYTVSNICSNGRIVGAAYIPDSGVDAGKLLFESSTTVTNAPVKVSNTFSVNDTIPSVANELNTALTEYYKALFAYAAWSTAATNKTGSADSNLHVPAFDYSKKLDGHTANDAAAALDEVREKYNNVKVKIMKLHFLNTKSTANTHDQTELEALQKKLDAKLLDLQGGPTSKFADMPEQLNTSMYTGLFWSVLAVSAVFVAFSQLG